MERPQQFHQAGHDPEIDRDRWTFDGPTTIREMAQRYVDALATREIAVRLLSDKPGSRWFIGPFLIEGYASNEEREADALAYYRQLGGDSTQMLEERILNLALDGIQQHICKWLAEQVMAGIQNHYFIRVNGALGYPFTDALAKAKAGDEVALLAILRAWPDALFDTERPFIQERVKALWPDAGFRARCGEAFKPINRDHRSTNSDIDFVLCFRPDLVDAHRAGKVSREDLRNHLKALGVPVDISAKSLWQRVHRSFRGGDSVASHKA